VRFNTVCLRRSGNEDWRQAYLGSRWIAFKFIAALRANWRASPMKLSWSFSTMQLLHFDTHFENILTDGRRLYFNSPPSVGHSRSRVERSSSPLQYFLRASTNTWLSAVTCANRVIDDRNFRLSGEPKISSRVRPCT
jgi:hypothetical protein